MTKTLPTAPLKAGGGLAPIFPQNIDEVFRLARLAFHAGILKPISKRMRDENGGWYDQEEDNDQTMARGSMIIMQGMEIGIPPMQALQLLALIGGRIVAHSEAVPGLLLARGVKLVRWMTGAPMADDWTAHCRLTRPDGQVFESAFSVTDAKQARLWDQRPTLTGRGGAEYPNDSAWFKYPDRMLRARALGFAAKDGAADVLRGIGIQEEAEDLERGMIDVTPKAPSIDDIPDAPSSDAAAPDAPATQERAGSGFQAGSENPEPPDVSDIPDFPLGGLGSPIGAQFAPETEAETLESVESALLGAPSVEILHEIWDANADAVAMMGRAAQMSAEAAYDKRKAAILGTEQQKPKRTRKAKGENS